MIRIALVGCGAVTAKSHLPALQRARDYFQCTAFVDVVAERAERLAAEMPGAVATPDLEAALSVCDAVILALPHHLHAEIGVRCLEAGKHVLMEKPLAPSVADCDRLIAAAVRTNRILGIGLVRRYLHGHGLAREIIQSGMLGGLTGFEVSEGGVYSWPMVSDFLLRRETAGGGVLIDTGAHVLDTLLWWLGELQLVSCHDNARGGIEADCELRLRTAEGVFGRVTLSRLRNLANTSIIRGERATLEIEQLGNGVTLRVGPRTMAVSGSAGTQTIADLFDRQLQAFRRAIDRDAIEDAGNDVDLPEGQAGRQVVALIEQAYRQRQSHRESWESWSCTTTSIDTGLWH